MHNVMTVDFLLAKLKTLAKGGVVWDGVEADLRALIRTESVRAGSMAKDILEGSKMPMGGYIKTEILRTSPGKVGG